MTDKVTVDLTTGIGTISFPHLFASTKTTNDKGETVYDVQLIIPKEQTEDIRAIMRAIKKVGEAKWGDKWKRVRTPLRDGDKEADDLTEDGKTKGEKHPERLGCYFINARSQKPVGVFDRQRNPIHDADAVYGGCKGKINVTFYAYSNQGNHGVGCGLNGVQKIADGEPFGGGAPAVESMFDMLDDDEDLGLDDDDLDDDLDAEDEEPTPPPAKKTAATKTAAKKTAAKKTTTARRKPAPEPEPEDDDLDDLDGEEEDDLYDDLDDLDEE
jgi:hypothetical protein